MRATDSLAGESDFVGSYGAAVAEPCAVPRARSARRRVVGPAASVLVSVALALALFGGRDGARAASEGAALAAATVRPGVPALSADTSSVRVENEYGEVARADLQLYGFDHVVEPHKDTTLSAVLGDARDGVAHWAVRELRVAHEVAHGSAEAQSQRRAAREAAVIDAVHASRAATPPADARHFGAVDGSSSYWTEDGALHVHGERARVRFTRANTRYTLVLLRHDQGHDSAGDGGGLGGVKGAPYVSADVFCKYVRREVRKLSASDKEAFLSTLEKVHRLEYREGFDTYGPRFSNFEKFATMHNSVAYCYHGGNQFVTTHPVFTLMLDQAMQSIDPSVTAPYWDFLVDGQEYGPDWWFRSPMYSEAWFGPMNNSLEDGAEAVLQHGRFAYLPEYRMGSSPTGVYREWQQRYIPLQNAYGYVYGDKTNNKGFMSRTNSMCGIDPRGSFATCGLFIKCFEQHNTFNGWEKCMERDVHAHMHAWHGGTWDCAVDVQAWLGEHADVPESIARFIVQNVGDTWLDYGTAGHYYSCPMSNACDLDTPLDECACSSFLDLESEAQPRTKVDSLLNSTLHQWHKHAYEGARYLESESAAGPFRWVDPLTGERISDDLQTEVSLLALKLVSMPGRAGAMSTGSAITDPLFWMIHPLFEKAWHVLRLSPDFEHYDMTWTNGTCPGSSLHDEQAFANVFDDHGRYYSNAELVQLLDPRKVPYMYTEFNQWGTCSWNPCTNCGVHEEDDDGGDASLSDSASSEPAQQSSERPGATASSGAASSEPAQQPSEGSGATAPSGSASSEPAQQSSEGGGLTASSGHASSEPAQQSSEGPGATASSGAASNEPAQQPSEGSGATASSGSASSGSASSGSAQQSSEGSGATGAEQSGALEAERSSGPDRETKQPER